MNAKDFDIDFLRRMAHSPIHNYVVRGLTSWLIGEPSKSGTMRLFVSNEEQDRAVTPHSHRFDLRCWVLKGSVLNHLWHESELGDEYRSSWQSCWRIGSYKTTPIKTARWSSVTTAFREGECYGMHSREIHSIEFSKGSVVLFMEGETKAELSMILEQVVMGQAVPLHVQPWMFRRGSEKERLYLP